MPRAKGAANRVVVTNMRPPAVLNPADRALAVRSTMPDEDSDDADLTGAGDFDRSGCGFSRVEGAAAGAAIWLDLIFATVLPPAAGFAEAFAPFAGAC